MPCLALVLALISPRLAIAVVWIFSDILSGAFESWLVPLVGFFLLPWTTLAYALAWDIGTNAVTGIEWFFVGLAFVVDLGSYGIGGARGRR